MLFAAIITGIDPILADVVVSLPAVTAASATVVLIVDFVLTIVPDEH
jgi:hypothetical protein